MDNQKTDRLGFMMEQALGSMTSTLAAAFRKAGIDLPHSQDAVLRLIYTVDEPLTQRKIAAILKKDAAAIKRTVDLLERKGLVSRQAQNGRTNYILPTEAAIAIKDRLIGIADETLQNIFGGFSAQELALFTDILERLAHSKHG